jgi:hypothetical protein
MGRLGLRLTAPYFLMQGKMFHVKQFEVSLLGKTMSHIKMLDKVPCFSGVAIAINAKAERFKAYNS